jgi:hypothetical protein
VLRRARLPLAALLCAAGAAVLAGCGGGTVHHGTFTDCATVGPPSVTTDPRGDESGGSGKAAEAPQGDLLVLRIARGGGRLCVEFQAAGPIAPSAAYAVALRPADRDTPLVQLEALVLAAAAPHAQLSPAVGKDFEDLDATVGIRDDRLSILVSRSEFSRYGVAAIFDDFRFQARAAVVTKDDVRLGDCLPDC